MPTEFMFSASKPYPDGVRVPFYQYKCKAGHTVQGNHSDDPFKFRATTQHTCKIVIDHDEEDHRCVCGITWPNSQKKEKV